jgi:hypothetical protein
VKTHWKAEEPTTIETWFALYQEIDLLPGNLSHGKRGFPRQPRLRESTFSSRKQIPADALNHRTNTGPRIGQTATRVSDRSRYRRLAGRITVYEKENACSCRLKDEENRRLTMRAVTVYRWDDGRKTKDSIGVVFEKRKTERASNYFDLLRLARRLFAVNTADTVHIIIDLSHTRRTILPELTSDCSAG